MAQIKDQISADMKASMKAGDKKRTMVLRMLLSEIQYAKVEDSPQKDLSSAEELAVLSRYFKRLEKSLSDYAGTDRIDDIKAEMDMVQAYLPKKASEDEVRKVVDDVLASTDDRNFGVLMKAVLARLGTGADGKLVSQILKARLAES